MTALDELEDYIVNTNEQEQWVITFSRRVKYKGVFLSVPKRKCFYNYFDWFADSIMDVGWHIVWISLTLYCAHCDEQGLPIPDISEVTFKPVYELI